MKMVKVNENEALCYDMWGDKVYVETSLKQWEVVLHSVKLSNPLSFWTRFPKSGSAYSRQVVNPGHQTLQGQSVTKPGTLLYSILVENLNMT